MYKKAAVIVVIILTAIKGLSAQSVSVDSIMNMVHNAAKSYATLTRNYEAEVYLKTNISTKKKNCLYKFTKLIPKFVLHDTKNDRGLIESVSKLKYEAPANYFQDIKHVSGTMTRKQDIAMLPFRFISMDIYAESAPEELFYLPLREVSARYYDYQLAYADTTSAHKIYSINFTPKYKNPQLIAGYFMVEEGSWRVLGLSGEGTDLFVDFSFNIKMGAAPLNWFLPTVFNLKETYKYLGNEVENIYQATINYQTIELNTLLNNNHNYNIGNRYRVRLDSVPLTNDSSFWIKNRPIPLSEDEQQMISEHRKKMLNQQLHGLSDSTIIRKKQTSKLAQSMVSNTNYRYKSTDIRYSGLLNPTMIGYSTQDGLTYRQSLNMAIDLKRQQRVNINADAGFIFERKHFAFNISTTWNYEPAKFGYLSFTIGKGNPTYSTYFLKQLNNTIPGTYNADLGYYKDYYAKVLNSIELTNGFQVGVGINYHIRHPNYIKNYSKINRLLQTRYNFVPMINLTWTAHQYYVTDRNQKVYVRSDYPTFKFEFAQSIPNVLKSTSSYSRLELDVSQNIRFDMLNNFNYHVGIGMFLRQENDFFNDFVYFAKSYFPESWGDGIGGSFSVLPIRFFNSSDRYIQAHTMYETSKLLLTRLPLLSNGVAKERLYLSQLYSPTLPSYTEMGYGIGNRFLNAALFVAFNKTKYYNLTAKVIFLF